MQLIVSGLRTLINILYMGQLWICGLYLLFRTYSHLFYSHEKRWELEMGNNALVHFTVWVLLDIQLFQKLVKVLLHAEPEMHYGRCECKQRKVTIIWSFLLFWHSLHLIHIIHPKLGMQHATCKNTFTSLFWDVVECIYSFVVGQGSEFHKSTSGSR